MLSTCVRIGMHGPARKGARGKHDGRRAKKPLNESSFFISLSLSLFIFSLSLSRLTVQAPLNRLAATSRRNFYSRLPTAVTATAAASFSDARRTCISQRERVRQVQLFLSPLFCTTFTFLHVRQRNRGRTC